MNQQKNQKHILMKVICMKSFILMTAITITSCVPLLTVEEGNAILTSPLKRSQDSEDKGGRNFLKSSKDGIGATAVTSLTASGDNCLSCEDSGESFSFTSEEDEENSSLSRMTLQKIPLLTLKRSRAQINKPKIIKAKSLPEAINCFHPTEGLPTCEGINSKEMVCIFDVDGTLNNHPSPDEHYSFPYGQRDHSVDLVRSFRETGGSVVFCSAYVKSGYELSFIREEVGFKETIQRLRDLGFTNDDLGVKEGDEIVKMNVLIEDEHEQTSTIRAYKYGAVVSCHRPNKLGDYFRGKFFAAAIAFPELCHFWKVVALVDDNLKGNIHPFLIDTKYNPYGADNVMVLSIHLSQYTE